jgi:hypothetical protein
VNPKFVRPDEPRRIVGCSAKLHAIIGDLRTVPLAMTLADMLAEREQSTAKPK